MYGVYVLWASAAGDRPTYLGEGVVLSRLNKHMEWLKSGVTGIVAKLDSKRDAEITEATLLWAAQKINRWLSQNKSEGKWKRVDTLLERHTSLRVNVRGRHPFVHPSSQRSQLADRVPISVWLERDEYQIDLHWNRRR